MAFCGITCRCIKDELESTLVGARITKIAEPSPDSLLFTIRGDVNTKLLISARASLPFIYLTDETYENPAAAPAFCMLMRKHLQNGKIIAVRQDGLERVIFIDVEHSDEMGDPGIKTLVIELMGKHSNIILVDDGIIVDSIKRVPANVSSVREVLPGKEYFCVKTTDKGNLLTASFEDFKTALTMKNLPVSKAIYSVYEGIAPVTANDICYRAGVDPDIPSFDIDAENAQKIYGAAAEIVELIDNKAFIPCIHYTNGEIKDFSAFPLKLYSGKDDETVKFDSMSSLLKFFYAEKNKTSVIKQKSADLRLIVNNLIERNVKKLDLWELQLKDTEKRDKYRIYGELLNTYGYSVSGEEDFLECVNYYDGETVKIPLDKELSGKDNAKKYFDKYSKLKRTNEALVKLIDETKPVLEQLISIREAISIAECEADLNIIKQELADSGFVKSGSSKNKKQIKMAPLHFVNSDGYDIFVGKNNYQNDYLTFKVATGNDIWFHAKKYHGSHVILQNKGTQIPDSAYEDAARLAAYYSEARGGKAEIDYIEKKHVKKPAGAAPGFVVYYTNYSMTIDSDISGLKQIKD